MQFLSSRHARVCLRATGILLLGGLAFKHAVAQTATPLQDLLAEAVRKVRAEG